MSLCNKTASIKKSISAADQINDKFSVIDIPCRKFKSKSFENHNQDQFYLLPANRVSKIATKSRKRNTTRTVLRTAKCLSLLSLTLSEIDDSAVISWTRWHSSRELQKNYFQEQLQQQQQQVC